MSKKMTESTISYFEQAYFNKKGKSKITEQFKNKTSVQNVVYYCHLSNVFSLISLSKQVSITRHATSQWLLNRTTF